MARAELVKPQAVLLRLVQAKPQAVPLRQVMYLSVVKHSMMFHGLMILQLGIRQQILLRLANTELAQRLNGIVANCLVMLTWVMQLSTAKLHVLLSSSQVELND